MIKNNKGFTLVELIVTLLILAILAAILIPTLLGYINKSKTSSLLEETNQIKVAAQAMYDQAYGQNRITFGASTEFENRGAVNFSKEYPYKDYTDAIQKLAAMKSGTCCCITYTDSKSISGIGSIKAIQYFDGKKGCTYYNAEYYTDENDTLDYPVPSQGLIDTIWKTVNSRLKKSNNPTNQIYIFT
jgi:prepilin-type N-terminal cleavage/methylation domain-containing protein